MHPATRRALAKIAGLLAALDLLAFALDAIHGATLMARAA
jgi:hypothetical protein